MPFTGDYGISQDPESFAVDQYRFYFTDKSRGAVIRLSGNGITPISDLGMRDYFKDAFKTDNITLLGSYGDNKKLYNLTIKGDLESNSSSSSGTGGGAGGVGGTTAGSTSSSTTSTTSTTVTNTGPIPTTGNALGSWARHGVGNWSKVVETAGWPFPSSIGCCPGGLAQGVVMVEVGLV